MQEKKFDIVIIGGGILGISIGYFLTLNSDANILLIEQEKNVSRHTSSRNTGKVHAPFLYDPLKKKIFAKTAFLGYEMWNTYSKLKGIYFKQDGVVEIAKEEKDISVLKKYFDWGIKNGLEEKDIHLLNQEETKKIEPNIKCYGSILCKKDASVDYGILSNSLKCDYLEYGGTLLNLHRVTRIRSEKENSEIELITDKREKKNIYAKYVINSSGGNSLDIARQFGIGIDLIDLHFRGEYWRSPKEYEKLTSHSIYSVPKQKNFPFLDPHWIVKADGHCEIGPNAVPVFGPYSYNFKDNFKNFFPKTIEIFAKKGLWSLITNSEFLSLITSEIASSFSKNVMINRVKRFLPPLETKKFKDRGISGIRSLVIDQKGIFIPDTLLLKNTLSMNILNYNSPGATGALALSAMLVQELIQDKTIKKITKNNQIWNIEDIYSKIKY
ncbi:MAG TPA: FAD-dependent oxidoreductase [Nitrososphaeraceae archaeon]|nr:FAD-dependent oxidoreductase [Nitrososphaeraceae archaeon]